LQPLVDKLQGIGSLCICTVSARISAEGLSLLMFVPLLAAKGGNYEFL